MLAFDMELELKFVVQYVERTKKTKAEKQNSEEEKREKDWRKSFKEKK